ncbi:ABC transporter ATP-binding protein [Philodulcilactobacillus myokoensis]|uniref:ABC transporter ATP-binding protein n=1 Tax=Philodulcilactobacillus myokoensis TaxID=2929573 RepID=A0A9W6B0B9_9LACO|nr:ABC transporter ATP-binding protein [Philodulcilactobacillus myokoensis]GLB46246.1 ABC transporter ATP-binding protein [Philodulcilactobacillus myokoensis]
MSTIEMKNISKIYQNGTTKTYALKDIQFKADNGNFITITGPSGAGKSTFLEIIGGLLTPTSGKLLINHHSYQNLNKKEKEKFRLNTLGFILQSYNLLPYLKVEEQFQLVHKVKKDNNVGPKLWKWIVDELGIQKLNQQYPDELSGGQKQRVAIARALYTNPQIILADEPTASLDSARAFKVMKMFKQLAQKDNKLIIVVTHDLRLTQFADQHYQIIDGQITKA